MNLAGAQTNELLHIGFNQDYGCFACGTDAGFRIYNCDPFKETFRREFSTGGIGIVEMLFRCNILAIVGGGKNPRYPPNKVMIWDDHQNSCIGELSFRSDVRAVRLRRDRVVVVLTKKVYVYNFADLKLVDHIETVSNERGLCALCPDTSNNVLACPGIQKGHVRVELYDTRKVTLIAAHESELMALSMNNNGTKVATASEKGTLIRVFDAQSGQLLQELRRGAERAIIHCITFNATSSFLACSSDKGTIHVFSLGEAGSSARGSASSGSAANEERNEKSSLSFMKNLLPKYFASQWSFAQFRVPETRTICAFGPGSHTLIVVGSEGGFYKTKFEKGGDCEKTSFSKFIKSEGDGVMDD